MDANIVGPTLLLTKIYKIINVSEKGTKEEKMQNKYMFAVKQKKKLHVKQKRRGKRKRVRVEERKCQMRDILHGKGLKHSRRKIMSEGKNCQVQNKIVMKFTLVSIDGQSHKMGLNFG